MEASLAEDMLLQCVKVFGSASMFSSFNNLRRVFLSVSGLVFISFLIVLFREYAAFHHDGSSKSAVTLPEVARVRANSLEGHTLGGNTAVTDASIPATKDHPRTSQSSNIRPQQPAKRPSDIEAPNGATVTTIAEEESRPSTASSTSKKGKKDRSNKKSGASAGLYPISPTIPIHSF